MMAWVIGGFIVLLSACLSLWNMWINEKAQKKVITRHASNLEKMVDSNVKEINNIVGAQAEAIKAISKVKGARPGVSRFNAINDRLRELSTKTTDQNRK